MTDPIFAPVRLSDSHPMCGFQIAMDEPSVAALPVTIRAAAEWPDSADFFGNTAVQMIVASERGTLCCGISLYLKSGDPYTSAAAIIHARDQLQEYVLHQLRSVGVACRVTDGEDFALRLLPEAPRLFMRRRRIRCIGQRRLPVRLDAPTHYFPAIESPNAAYQRALKLALQQHPGSGLALNLIPCRRTSGEKRLLDAALYSAELPEAYRQSYAALADADENFRFTLSLWGDAAIDLAAAVRSMSAAPVLPEPALSDEMRYDPWALHRRLCFAYGNPALGLIANSITGQELQRLCGNEA